MKKRVKFTPTERTTLINKSSFELDKDNYQTHREEAKSRREQYEELIKQDPEFYRKRERKISEHMQKTLDKLKQHGYLAEERSDGKYNICSLETAGKCFVVATLGYGLLRYLGIFKGGARSKRRTRMVKGTKRKTRKNIIRL
jgi:hypothetical protein